MVVCIDWYCAFLSGCLVLCLWFVGCLCTVSSMQCVEFVCEVLCGFGEIGCCWVDVFEQLDGLFG